MDLCLQLINGASQLLVLDEEVLVFDICDLFLIDFLFQLAHHFIELHLLSLLFVQHVHHKNDLVLKCLPKIGK